MLGNGTVKDAEYPKTGNGRHLQAISRNRAKIGTGNFAAYALLMSKKLDQSLGPSQQAWVESKC